LQEFYNAAATKLKFDKLKAKSILHNYKNFETIEIDFELIEQAADISILSKISFWDGLIIAAAEFAGCETLLSEDLPDGQIIRGVKIANPFKK